jgi:hypothetical protein
MEELDREITFAEQRLEKLRAERDDLNRTRIVGVRVMFTDGIVLRGSKFNANRADGYPYVLTLTGNDRERRIVGRIVDVSGKPGVIVAVEESRKNGMPVTLLPLSTSCR